MSREKQTSRSPTTPALSVPTNENASRTRTALSLWRAATKIDGTPAASYLRSRGIVMPVWPADLRFHLSCPFGGDRLTCMLGLVRNIVSDEPMAVHRTALDGSSKAFGDQPGRANKMALGPIRGGAIKLTADENVTIGLAIGEGIETCLSLLQIGWPMWCVLGTSGVAGFPVLPGIESLTIFADHDLNGAGDRAAIAGGERWRAAGQEVRILHPKTAGSDWNDALRLAI